MVKILIVRLGALGDILHALPAVTGMRAALPQATIGWLIEEKWSELLAALGAAAGAGLPSADKPNPQKPVVDLIHVVNTARWRKRMLQPSTLTEFRSMLKEIQHIGYDVALDFQGAIKSAILGRWSGATTKVGFGDPRESLARFLYSTKGSRSGSHVIEQDHALAAEALQKYLGSTRLKLLAPKLPRDAPADAWAVAEIQRLGIASFVMVNPGAGWGAKQWPAERFGEVAKALARHNLKTLVNAGPGEESLADAVVQASGGNAFVVRSSVGQLIALTRRTRLMIGGDTGPLHLAAAFGIPVVGLYGPTDPVRTGPFGTRAVVLRKPESKTTFSHHSHADEGLLKISAEEVIAAARHLLGSR